MIRRPNLYHQELEALYLYDFSLPTDLLSQILHLPRVSLVKDLETVLEDAIQNFEYYEEIFEGDENQYLAPAHAIFILGEIKAIESLPKLEYFFSQSTELVDFWMGDLLTEELWIPFYKLAEDNILKLFPFIKKEGVSSFSKSPFSEAAMLYFVFHPERKAALLPSYNALLDYLIVKANEHPEWDENNENLSNVILDIICNQIAEFKPAVEFAVEADLIDEIIEDGWEIELEMPHEDLYKFDQMEQTIFEHYEEMYDDYSFTVYRSFSEFSNFFPTNTNVDLKGDWTTNLSLRKGKTVNEYAADLIQNGACPCGSGQKYGTCCLTISN